MSTFTKGLVMTIITLLAVTIQNSGIPATLIGWEYLGITTLGTILIYFGKNYVFPSVSAFGEFDWRDFLSTLFISLGTGVSGWIATQILSQQTDWLGLAKMSLTVLIGCVIKYFTQGQKA